MSGEKAGLAGCCAVVTGASRGIGKGAAIELGAAGATVYVTGRTVDDTGMAVGGTVGATVAEVEALGGKAVAVACDHTQDEQVQSLFERVLTEQGRLDVLLNSAFYDPGIAAGKPFWETPLGWYDDLNAAGTRGVYVASHHASRIMVPQGSGLIANVSSLGAEYYYQHVAYGMGKAAVDKFTADAGKELKKHGVSVVSIWPYFVKTEMVHHLVDQGIDLPLDGAESARFVGRGVVALATDPKCLEHTRRAYTSRELADLYTFKDIDGSLPNGSTVPRR